MAFVNMYSELTGVIPKLPTDYAKTLIKRAWDDVCRQNLWSYQLFESNWVSPAIENAGTVTTTQGLNTVVFDATASTAIAALHSLPGPFPTPLLQRQFRVGISTIYNIWGYSILAGIVTLTLDRAYTDASGAGQPYMIFQCYYPAPFLDFRTWINVRDIVNFNDLNLMRTRKQIDLMDPQRSISYIPTDCVFYQQNQNPASPTYGVSLFELWGQPQYVLTYQTYGIRKGTPLVNDGDTLPFAVGEDCVTALGRKYAYEWAEGNKGDMPRNQGSDFKFLAGEAMNDYKRLFRNYRMLDRDNVDNWFGILRHRGVLSITDGYYNAIGNTANPGAPY